MKIAKLASAFNKWFHLFAILFVLWELIFNFLIIHVIRYTEIDWKAYMQEVDGYLHGDWDYAHLRGGTGPLVYPGGFVYLFSLLYQITTRGTNIRLAQYIFAIIYVCLISVVYYLYHQALFTKQEINKRSVFAGLFVFISLSISKRIHSIFVLRCFNDGVAMLILYLAIVAFLNDDYTNGCILYSAALSVKMNILLFLPGLLVLLVKRFGFFGMMKKAFYIILVQLIVAIPFCIENCKNYWTRSFSFSRKFLYEWTVNYRFISEDVFSSDTFGKILLLGQLITLCIYGLWKWTEHEGVFNVLFGRFRKQHPNLILSKQHILYVLFTSNFIGIVFAKSLHYQFYVWYYHTLPFLFLCTRIPTWISFILIVCIEYCWNVFPSTRFSSAILTSLHFALLGIITFTKTEYPYEHKKD